MNFGSSFLQLSNTSMRVVMKMERKQPPGWLVFIHMEDHIWVDIWEERKVFGSRGQSLKDEILGKNPTPTTASNGKSSNPIRVVKRDAQSLRIKLAVGGLPERIISAFHLVHEESVNEEAAFSKSKSAVSWFKELGKDIESSSHAGSLQGSELVEKMQEHENALRHCVTQLENFETTRLALVSQLNEALRDQESKLELIRNELEVARSQIEQTLCVKQKLVSSSYLASQSNAGSQLMEAARVAEANLPLTQLSSMPILPPTPPITFTSSKLNEEENKKAAAAAVVAKLAASTSSAQMLTSVLSSLVAEEVASMSNGLTSTGFSSSLPFGSPEKRPKLENPVRFSEVNHSDGSHAAFFASAQQTVSNMPVGAANGMQLMSQGNQLQATFPQPPPPPPPPPQSVTPGNSSATQLGQSAAMMIGVPYGYGSSNLPPPPLPPHMPMGFARPAPLPTQQPPPQQLQNQQSQQQQQQAAAGGYYRPPGIGFYAQGHQSATPPVPRQ
ncbi:uncharacterized protein [Coffea arabica]|uniref:Uncharacterized protein isoform X2 n=1 Tax=Coffea arabica TaxID=13443 RepID=A0ABM4V5F2_COFAR